MTEWFLGASIAAFAIVTGVSGVVLLYVQISAIVIASTPSRRPSPSIVCMTC